MENNFITYNIPYKVGTYLERKNGVLDKLIEYKITEDGLFAILLLDVRSNEPFVSDKIQIYDLIYYWKLSNINDLIVQNKNKLFN